MIAPPKRKFLSIQLSIMKKAKKKNTNILIIQILAFVIIVLGIVIMMGYSMTRQSDRALHEFFITAHELYLTVIRAIIVVIGAFFTIRYYLQKKGKLSRFRFISLISFSTMAFIFYILIPLITDIWDIYNALMPFPWTTVPLRFIVGIIYVDPSPQDMYIAGGYTTIIFAYFAYQLFVFIGTIFLGRRWQCSMLCLNNGSHAETMGIALPIIPQNKERPRSKQIKPSLKKVLLGLQLFIFSLNMLLIFFWALLAFWGIVLVPILPLVVIEIVKYLLLETILLMALWIFVGGRGYCYYCPAGFLLGFIGKAVGQRIETNLTNCVKCGACNDACNLSIDILALAKDNRPVKTIHCTGCGHCVDSCPTQNLKYRTNLVD